MDSESKSYESENEGTEIVSISLTTAEGQGQQKPLPSKEPAQPQSNKRPLLPYERRIGNYILGKSIGEGTFGKVKIGVHEPTGEKVRHLRNLLNVFKIAVKILQKSKMVDNADIERVSREIHILKIVQHPHIV